MYTLHFKPLFLVQSAETKNRINKKCNAHVGLYITWLPVHDIDRTATDMFVSRIFRAATTEKQQGGLL